MQYTYCKHIFKYYQKNFVKNKNQIYLFCCDKDLFILKLIYKVNLYLYIKLLLYLFLIMMYYIIF